MALLTFPFHSPFSISLCLPVSLVSCFAQSHLHATYANMYAHGHTLYMFVVSVHVPVGTSVGGGTRVLEVDVGFHYQSMSTLF